MHSSRHGDDLSTQLARAIARMSLVRGAGQREREKERREQGERKEIEIIVRNRNTTTQPNSTFTRAKNHRPSLQNMNSYPQSYETPAVVSTAAWY